MKQFILENSTIMICVLVVVGVIIILLLLAKLFYKKAPPNVAMVVTGPAGTKTVVGKASIVIPIIQRVDYMSLENIQVDFTSKDEIPTRDAINILVDAVANISISKDPDLMKIASSKFLGYTTEDIQKIVIPVLEENIREIISQTTLKSLIQGDKKELAEKVVENVTPNLRDMGLDLTTFNIQNFKDKNGVIDNLGIQNTVQISKDAAISKADAESEIAIKQAEAAKRANDAKVLSELEIAQRQNELSIRKAELKKTADIKDAEAEAAKGIQQEQQRKTLEITTAEANLARQEKEIELKEREVTIKERTLEAEVKKTAEAEKYAKEQEAQVIRTAGLAEAEAISAKGKAEAEAIRAKAEAEAEGLMKKAEAMAAYGDAAKQDMQLQALKVYFEQLPEIARGIAEGYSKVDKINIYGGNSAKLQSDLINNMTQISEGLNQSMGIDLKGLLSGMLGAKIIENNKEE